MSGGLSPLRSGCQVGVFAALAAGTRATLIDMDLDLPEEWTSAPKRCAKVHIPEDMRTFRTKPAIALELIRRQRSLDTRFNWISFDSFYGRDGGLLRTLDDEGEIFAADIPCSHRIRLQDPRPAAGPAQRWACG